MPWLIHILRVLLFPVSCFVNLKHHWFQYLFFLRIPLTVALALVGLPIISHWQFPVMAKNLFDLDGTGLLIVTVLALLLSWVTMYTFWLIYMTAPQHYRLTFNKDRHREQRKLGHYCNVLPRLIKLEIGGIPVRHFWFGLLAIFLIAECYAQSTSGDSCNWLPVDQDQDCRVASIMTGIMAAVLTWFLLDKTSHALIQAAVSLWGHHRFQPLFKPIEQSWTYFSSQVSYAHGVLSERFVFVRQRYIRQTQEDDDQDVVFTKKQALALGLMTLAFYLLGFVLLDPTSTSDIPSNIPPLAYILMLFILLAWIIPKLTMWLDAYRIPVVLFLVTLTLLFQWGLGSDYFYQLSPHKSAGPAPTRLPDAYKAWRQKKLKQKIPPTLVVVTASGGGITASTWTATVLTELEKQPELKDRFAKSIFLLSAASGGAVGSMYFVDAYDDKGLENKTTEEIDRIVAQASTSISGAAGWGVIYPDFWRLFPFLTFWSPSFVEKYDRAWALERRWERPWLQDGKGVPPTLRSWEDGIKEGWRPIAIFNATISETGEPFLLAPIPLMEKGTSSCSSPMLSESNQAHSQQKAFRIRELFELYPNYDMPVVTAARLSASFPFLSPLARPEKNSDNDCNAYHIADGGYFDNFGVITALRLLNDTLEGEMEIRRTEEIPGIISTPPLQIVLLEIRAFDSKNSAKPSAETTLIDEFLGPLNTMANARWSSQLLRNNEDVSRFITQWEKSGIPVLNVIFEQDSDSPLSWHLTKLEKEKLKTSFKEQLQPIQCLRDALTRKPGTKLIGRCDREGLSQTSPLQPETRQQVTVNHP